MEALIMDNQTSGMDKFWDQKQVLVTGAGGFIGSHLVEQLAGFGAQVRAFVRYNSRGDAGLLRMLSPEVRGKLKILSGDLRDGQAMQDAVTGCEYVFHLGALISIQIGRASCREGGYILVIE